MKKSQLRQIIKEELLKESLEFTPEERKKLIYILKMKLIDMEETGEKFFAEEIEMVENILMKVQ
jgi:hypothetical protein